MAGIATFGPGTNSGIPIYVGPSSGIPISGQIGPSSQNIQVAAGSGGFGNPNAQITVPGGSPGIVEAANTAKTNTDPYANTVFGSTAGYNAALGNYNSARDSTYNSINDTIGDSAGKYNSSLLDYLDSRKQQQNSIDSGRVQNELSRDQGQQGILDMIGNGLRSSGAVLANKNAGSSSANEAIARAYSTLGRQQSSSVGNQFAQGEDKFNTDQTNLGLADATELRHSAEDKTSTINSIVNTTRAQLAALNATAASASLPDQIDIEAKANEIRQTAYDQLGAYDKVLTNGISGQGPMASTDIRGKAQQLLTSGVAPADAFNYNTSVPVQFQDTGQFATDFPLFINPRKQQTA